MKRVYYPFWEWEDIGMWRIVESREKAGFLKTAIEFTGNAKRYGAAMIEVLTAYPIATLHNLTDEGQNRRAWIGHAACYLATQCPEDITREAWGLLTQQQRDEANAVADIAITTWETEHNEKKDCGLYCQMEIAGLSKRHS
jgi:hypothetical protein